MYLMGDTSIGSKLNNPLPHFEQGPLFISQKDKLFFIN